jgi:hypothetical protein
MRGYSPESLAARSTQPIQVRSLLAVAAATPLARRARIWSTNVVVLRARALIFPMPSRSRYSGVVCLVRLQGVKLRKESLYQRINAARDGPLE